MKRVEYKNGNTRCSLEVKEEFILGTVFTLVPVSALEQCCSLTWPQASCSTSGTSTDHSPNLENPASKPFLAVKHTPRTCGKRCVLRLRSGLSCRRSGGETRSRQARLTRPRLHPFQTATGWFRSRVIRTSCCCCCELCTLFLVSCLPVRELPAIPSRSRVVEPPLGCELSPL
eukprot:2340421-Rhodomonas_salina.1